MTNAAPETGLYALSPEKLLDIHRLMVRARLLEERLIKMSKGGDGYFWIGGPGEEAFNVPLGLQIKKGRGVDYDFLHLHYRSSAIALAMGAEPLSFLRQMRNTEKDPFSKGRNFINHIAIPEVNLLPISSTIETQYSTAIGTAIAQARENTDAVTIVNGGDAGSAEGDFHSCLVWANRPALPLPILIIVVDNGYGISTEMRSQHGEKSIADWAKTFPEMPGVEVDGNDAAASWAALETAFGYVRKERKPYLLVAKTSRLNGHSSSSGANREKEFDCLPKFEEELLARGVGSAEAFDAVRTEEGDALTEGRKTVREEHFPKGETIWEDVFADGLPDSYPTKGGS
jgi:2-oxoisovalerate dehydrogenase E1 component alpha subunit